MVPNKKSLPLDDAYLLCIDSGLAGEMHHATQTV